MFASLLTLLRFLLAFPVFYAIYTGKELLAVALISAGAITDFLDGWVARRFAQSSRLGAQLDHIGDKLFVLLTLTAFYLSGEIEFLSLLLLAVREILITLFRFYGLAGSVNGWGKLKTLTEFLSLLFLCVEPAVGKVLLWVSVILAYLSAALYIGKPVKVGF